MFTDSIVIGSWNPATRKCDGRRVLVIAIHNVRQLFAYEIPYERAKIPYSCTIRSVQREINSFLTSFAAAGIIVVPFPSVIHFSFSAFLDQSLNVIK